MATEFKGERHIGSVSSRQLKECVSILLDSSRDWVADTVGLDTNHDGCIDAVGMATVKELQSNPINKNQRGRRL